MRHDSVTKTMKRAMPTRIMIGCKSFKEKYWYIVERDIEWACRAHMVKLKRSVASAKTAKETSLLAPIASKLEPVSRAASTLHKRKRAKR